MENVKLSTLDKQVRLRLDYFLNNANLAEDDIYKNELGKNIVVGKRISVEHSNERCSDDCLRSIVSLAPRENITGEQPCGDDVPVAVVFNDNSGSHSALGYDVIWSISGEDDDVKTWTPDIDALIKMQVEFDESKEVEAQKERMLHSLLPDSLIRKKPTAKEVNENFICEGVAFVKATSTETVEIKPNQGDKVRIEQPVYTRKMFNDADKIQVGMIFIGPQGKDACTALSVFKASDGCCVAYEYEKCSIGVCWHNATWIRPIETQQDIDNRKQRDRLDKWFADNGFMPPGNLSKKMQDAGLLCDIKGEFE